jgi:hypothetical protein
VLGKQNNNPSKEDVYVSDNPADEDTNSDDEDYPVWLLGP